MSYQVLARKYRPTNFKEVVGQDHVVQALSNSISQDRIHQAYLLAGTRGVGKTTIARILAKCLNCQSADGPVTNPCDECSACEEIKAGRHLEFLEIDAASRTGVDDMRELIENVQYKPSNGLYKIYLIDEVHMLSKASFNALLKTLEEPPEHVVFIFATTDPDKIPKTVLSRCLQLNLKIVPQNILQNHLLSIVKDENVPNELDALGLIAESANGSVRDALTLLDQAIAHGAGSINLDEVKSLLGTIDHSYLYSMIHSVINGDGLNAFKYLDSVAELNPEYDHILQSIISILHKVSLEQVLGDSDIDEIKKLASIIDPEFCQLIYEIAVNAYSMFHVHPNPKEALEICLLRMIAFNPLKQNMTDFSHSSESEKKNKIIEKAQIPKSKVKNVKEIKVADAESSTKQPVEEDNEVFASLKSYDEWNKAYHLMDLSPFSEALFGNLEFVSHEQSLITLRGDIDKSSIPQSVLEEFQNECSSFLKLKITIKFEQGSAINSPANISAEINSKKQSSAKSSIANDLGIQDIMKKFNGKIQDGSIKPLD
ncbi:MAG: DNA polymerase III subunit gamma/tau [SAR86 cluster bacterium]|uniref:DNA polymerase III subunit gamma/tau n=1 Tax=SAR86 cluster bacterium TaxID=2030880 RepID=A0A937M0F9_9GAMM|nr:DNA polymerase III subunit gamma/tau [SAR86 cluster bacterium]